MQHTEADMSSKNRVTVNLSDDEFKRLNHIASQANVSKAWVIRHALRDLLGPARNDDQLTLPLAETKRGEAK
ncbi:MAG: CopG family transcriptional regulator [Nitrosospira sp.]